MVVNTIPFGGGAKELKTATYTKGSNTNASNRSITVKFNEPGQYIVSATGIKATGLIDSTITGAASGTGCVVLTASANQTVSCAASLSNHIKATVIGEWQTTAPTLS